MIHFIIGKPRNGKTLRAMLLILEQLETTERIVVTNMVLDLTAIQELLDSRGRNVHVIERVFMLSDEDTRHFWLHRGCGYKLPVPADYEGKNGANVDYTPIFEESRWRVGGVMTRPDGQPQHLRGTFYVIDECHTLWPARGWQGTPRHADFYNSQHGKLNDEVVFITQNLKLVDPNFARLAQDFTYCRNHRLEKHGWFRGDNKFVAKTYGWPAQGPHEPTLNEFVYKLDLRVTSCYDTSAGVGMPGGGTADAAQRAKGVPLKLVWLALAALIVLCWVTMRYGIPAFSNRFLVAAIDPRGAVERNGSAACHQSRPGDGATGLTPAGLRKIAPADFRSAEITGDDAEVQLDGWILTGRGPVVWLSDGRELDSSDGIRELRSDMVVLRDGTTYRFRNRQEERARESIRFENDAMFGPKTLSVLQPIFPKIPKASEPPSDSGIVPDKEAAAASESSSNVFH